MSMASTKGVTDDGARGRWYGLGRSRRGGRAGEPVPKCMWATLWTRLLALPVDMLGVDGMRGELGVADEGDEGETDDEGADEPQPT